MHEHASACISIRQHTSAYVKGAESQLLLLLLLLLKIEP
jgi:hypothetical protein